MKQVIELDDDTISQIIRKHMQEDIEIIEQMIEDRRNGIGMAMYDWDDQDRDIRKMQKLVKSMRRALTYYTIPE